MCKAFAKVRALAAQGACRSLPCTTRNHSLEGSPLKRSLLGAMFLAFTAPFTFAAERSPACEAKQAALETQISEATARGRSQEATGLQRALAANKARCTDAALAQERDADIRDARRKVAAREKALAEAERKGDAKKTATRRAKLEDARRALAEAEKPLAQ